MAGAERRQLDELAHIAWGIDLVSTDAVGVSKLRSSPRYSGVAKAVTRFTAAVGDISTLKGDTIQGP